MSNVEDLRTKLNAALHNAERWQAEVLRLEAAALKRATEQMKGRLRRKDGYELEVDYVAKQLLKDNFPYSRAVANRNAAQALVTMYALSALALEAIEV